METLEGQLFRAGLFVPVGGLALWGLYRLLRPVTPPLFRVCLWNAFFHVYCPGCGGTRALGLFFQGHFLASLWYHPLVGYCIVIYLLFMGSQGLSLLTGGRMKGMKYRNGYLYGAVAILVLNLVCKNVLRLVWGIALEDVL